jgi:RNA polymerase sigma factor (sigma-70 family)
MRPSSTSVHSNAAETSGDALENSPLLRAQRKNGLAVRPRAVVNAASGAVATRATPVRRLAKDLPEGREGGRSTQTAPTARPLVHAEEQLLKLILSEPVDYIDHAEYHQDGAEERIYGFAEIERPDVTWYRPLMDDFISARSRSARTPKSQSSILLTGAQERILFMKYNFARFRMSEIQQASAGRALTLAEARSVLRWHTVATRYREQLAETNLALVLAMAKRVRLSEVDFADLIGEGNMALMRSVDKFDCGRGFKFSTYACRAILKAFSRHGIKVTTQRKRFGAEYDPALEKSNHLETVRATHERECADEVRHIVVENKADLSDIERAVIGHRFGLPLEQGAAEIFGSAIPAADPDAAPLTLEQVGQVIGVTKERVRQIQNRALEKIRLALQDSNPDAARELAEDIALREGRTHSAKQLKDARNPLSRN